MTPRAPASSPAEVAGRQAAWLFGLTGVLVATTELVTHREVGGHLIVVGIILLLAFTFDRLPWSRWNRRATLLILPAAVGVIGLANSLNVLPIRSYGV